MPNDDQPPAPSADEKTETANASSPAASPTPPAEGGSRVASADMEVDEVLASLPVRPRRSPIVALSVLAVAGVIMAALLPDLRYALSPRDPLPLGDARALSFEGGPLVDNRLVSLGGPPDYRNALLFEPKGDNYRRAFYRMLGTRSRLWVRAEQTSSRRALGGPIVGRLRRFDALPYAAQVRAYYAEQVKTTRLLDVDELRRTLEAGSPISSVHDRGGEPVAGEEGGEVRVVVDFPDELLVSLSRDKFAVADDARRELERLGEPVGPVREGKEEFVFPVRVRSDASPAPSATAPSVSPSPPVHRFTERDAYIARLEDKGFAFRLRREPFSTTFSALRAAPGGALSIPASPSHPPIFDVEGTRLVPRAAAERVELPWARIDSVQLSAPIRIPASAWVVVEGERPEDFRYALLLSAVLAVFAAFDVWLLIRSLSRR